MTSTVMGSGHCGRCPVTHDGKASRECPLCESSSAPGGTNHQGPFPMWNMAQGRAAMDNIYLDWLDAYLYYENDEAMVTFEEYLDYMAGN